MSQLRDKVVLVTGGTSGIGRATAVAFAREGAKVAVTGRREVEGQETLRLVRHAGAQGLFVKADVTQESDCRRMVEETVTAFGRLDCAFNNAGIEGMKFKPIAEQTAENFRQVFDINVLGMVLSLKYEIPAMLKTGGGAIVNCASVAGSIGFPGMSMYVASKHAVIGLTKSAALDYAKEKIRVNAVSPGAIETEMFDRFADAGSGPEAIAKLHPVGRTGTPEEIAAAVLFLCSPAASFITGANLLVDGGWTVP